MPVICQSSVNRLLLGSGSRVAYLKIISLEASFSCESDGAIDKPHSVKLGPKIAKLHFDENI